MPPKKKPVVESSDDENDASNDESDNDSNSDDSGSGSDDGSGGDSSNDDDSNDSSDNDNGSDDDSDGDDDDEDDEEEEEEEPKGKKRPASAKSAKAKQPVKKRSKKDASSDEDSDDSDDEDDDEPKKGKKAPTKKAAKPKAKAKAVTKKAAAKKADKKAVTKKKTTKKTAGKSKDKKKKSSSSKSKSSSSSSAGASTKELSKLGRLEEARKAYKWWEAPELPEGINWRQLEHCGVKFAKPYARHNVPLLYNKEPVHLTAAQEEIATFYAATPEDGPQLGNPKTRPVFQQNFFNDFKEELGAGHVIKNFDLCDMSLIREHLELQKNLKKAATDKEKADRKLEKEQTDLQYGYALIDGRMEKMGNFNMEPPSLFKGRGEHPLTGHLKLRCFSESVNLNLSEDSPVPIPNLPGHAWASVRHDPAVTWLCNWTESVQDNNKYVMLAASSSFKGKSDKEKYSTAIRLRLCIDKIRSDYLKKIKSQDLADRQIGTAMWVIDILALRVGGEKGEDEADTVGTCSLRLEHLKFLPADHPDGPRQIELEFLGKDSMLFKQTINFKRYGDIGVQVYDCLKSFCAGKKQDEDVFDTLTPTILNQHLKSLMPGLSAKVFRTYNASVTLEKELPTAEDLKDLSLQEKVVRYNAANREVAILCNHQKTVSKATEASFEKMKDRVDTVKKQLSDLISWKALLKKKQGNKIPLAENDSEAEEKLKLALEKANKMKETAVTKEQKLDAAAAVEKAKFDLNEVKKNKFLEQHMWKTTPNESQIESRIEKWTSDIKKLEIDFQNKEENKEVALGTSKINYMDPRITVAWCKRCEVPIEKVFPKTLLDKFNWAMAVEPNWKFE